MRISYKEQILLVILALVFMMVWCRINYPFFSFIDLSVGRRQAFHIAKTYLSSQKINTSTYLTSVVFRIESWADKYLQKTSGFKGEDEFIRKYDYELFSWSVRFFKERQKEEFILKISPKTGEVIFFRHLIEDTEERPTQEKELARQKAEEFLRETYNIDFRDYLFHEERIKKYENRTDYSFSWERKGLYIPWIEEGGAKLLVGATVSGDEIRQFYKNYLDIPENFKRYVENQEMIGGFLSGISFLFLIFLIVSSVVILIKRREDQFIRLSWRWFVFIAIFIFIIEIISYFNDFQEILSSYPTSSHFGYFIGLHLLALIFSFIFVAVSIIIPGVSAESLRDEVYPERVKLSFSKYVGSTFFSRSVTRSIFLAYLIAPILLGFQAILFYYGQKYLGIWSERIYLVQLSSSYLPFLSGFIIGSKAAFSEEILFRVFGITFGKRYLKSTLLAVILTSLIWGFGHTKYLVFPVWFRGIEVTILGFLLGFTFIRYGIITLIITHYLFDAFWGVSSYLFGRSPAYLFLSSLFILVIPFIFGLACFILNRKEGPLPKIVLDSGQQYNLEILVIFLKEKKRQNVDLVKLKEELIYHNWNRFLVEEAFKRIE